MAEQVLDLGCGNNKKAGATGIDIAAIEGVDIVHDLNRFPYPCENNSFDRILVKHVIEHIPDTIGVMREIHRIGKPGALVEIRTPHYASIDSYVDPTHVHHFAMQTFHYLCGETAYRYTLGVKFELLHCKPNFWYFNERLGRLSYGSFGLEWFARTHFVFFERFLAWIFPIREIRALLKIHK